MKRRRFISKKYFDKYNDLKQKSDTIPKLKNALLAKVININQRPETRSFSRQNRRL